MNIEEFRTGLDYLFECNRIPEVEPYLESALRHAIEENDDAAVIYILNEMTGFYRETCDYDRSVMYGEKALQILESAEEAGSIHYATTQINLANALRAAGRLEESMDHYLHAEAIYKSLLVPDAFDFASLYNNMSLVYQEAGRYSEAVECLNRAMEIVSGYPDRRFELAVTHANLGNSLLGVLRTAPDADNIPDGSGESIRSHLNEAVEIFRERNENGAHLAAAICGLGDLAALEGDDPEAARYYVQALDAIEHNLGRIDYYYRVKEKLDAVRDRLKETPDILLSGIELCRRYYDEVVAGMIADEYPELAGNYSAGLFGEGSDAYGYDDLSSRDHDWGPGVIILIHNRGLYDRYAADLRESLIRTAHDTGLFHGFAPDVASIERGRRGVFWTDDYFRDAIGGEDIRYAMTEEYELAAVVNGEVFYDPEGVITAIREDIGRYHPEHIRKRMLMQESAMYSQHAQYNYLRMKRRNDSLTADMMLTGGLKCAAHIRYILAKKYAPHDKWLFRGLRDIDEEAYHYIVAIRQAAAQAPDHDPTDARMRPVMDAIDALAMYLQSIMQAQGLISRPERYMEDIIPQLSGEAVDDGGSKAEDSAGDRQDADREGLVSRVVHDEWEAFDRVINEGGRADCQDNWNTFNIMRSSQYLTWDIPMLVQFAEDFEASVRNGWNPIMEKYARMEESTAPDRYEAMKDQLPSVPDEKRAIIEEIVSIQVGWMEEFARDYPAMAGNARTIHTADDTPYDTSYETYLRGELLTYSDEMLALYGDFIVRIARSGGNLARMTMENTALLYGYKSLDDAEESLKKSR